MTTRDEPVGAVGDPRRWLLPGWPWTLRAVGVAGLVGAEVGHTVALDVRFGTRFWIGVCFVAVAAVAGLLAGWLAVRPSRSAYLAATGGSGVLLALAPVVGADPATTLCEAVALVALLPLAASTRLRGAAARERGRGGSVVAAAMIATLVGGSAVGAYRAAGAVAPVPPRVEQPAGPGHVH